MERGSLGAFEELVLLAVGLLDGEAYGNAVQRALAEHTGRSVTLGAIHATLYRLQDKGLVDSELGGATEKRGGRRKRLFHVTSAGRAALRDTREVREQLWALQPKLNLVGGR